MYTSFLNLSYVNGRWTADTIGSYKVFQQFRREAGIANLKWPDGPDAYDKLLMAAGVRGWGLSYKPEDMDACVAVFERSRAESDQI
jgi:hypothetical protein